jgi:hypothetical protein
MLNFYASLYKEIYTRLLMNDVLTKSEYHKKKIIAETKIRKKSDNLYQIKMK